MDQPGVIDNQIIDALLYPMSIIDQQHISDLEFFILIKCTYLYIINIIWLK